MAPDQSRLAIADPVGGSAEERPAARAAEFHLGAESREAKDDE